MALSRWRCRVGLAMLMGSVACGRTTAGATVEAGAAAAGTAAGGGSGLGNSGQGDAANPSTVMGLDCNGEALWLDAERVEQCVLLTTCAPFGQTRDCIADGLDSISFRFSPQGLVPRRLDARTTRCLGSLSSCDDVVDCTGERYPEAGECEIGQTSRCDGELAISCDGRGRVRDCELLTGKRGACQVFGGANPHAECVVAECESTDDASRGHCNGDMLYHCDGPGPGYGMDCSAVGLTCVERDGSAECLLPREQEGCDSPGTGSCDGAIISFCGEDGVLYERDCSLLGDMVCVQGTGGLPEATRFDCVPRGCRTPSHAADRCDGDDLVLAIGQDNEGVRVDCAGHGFAGCEVDPRDATARCVP